ncbi:glucose-1-phosphate cytidylyltransferase [Pseudolabrys sp. FHR47]|uniref:glucose-1-phosphate cytidylyltransferase n=1 Tax=Pseudolabrys sp. FHR47 TaxID=2562284 RepID=UPI0010BE6B5F|nr:glucose-1-phosphate cytidylyltransferase [Pseudolabrys sp. FHR47]
MKVVILAGGWGMRLREYTDTKPKPMIEIGGRPILWHIMKIYSSFGYNQFVICLGYRGYMIVEYFANYGYHNAVVNIDMSTRSLDVRSAVTEPWQLTLVDTGEGTMTGGRLKRVRDYIGDETFCMTYGDGVGDINIPALVDFHQRHGRHATVTATRPPARFGALNIDDSQSVTHFEEKPVGDGGWINGGFFVLSPKVFDYIDNDQTPWETAPLQRLAADNQLKAYRHEGFWQPMDTLRDLNLLQELWSSGRPPWKNW